MASTFARALPHARVTTHDPRVVQVLTAPATYLSRGDFGLKSSIQPAIQAAVAGRNGEVRFIQVREQDSTRVATGLEWKERESEVLLLRRWQEMQGRVQSQEDIDESKLDGIEPSSQIKTKAVNQPLPSSRFDRTSRNLSSPQAKLSSSPSARQATGQVPNYLLYSEKQFQSLLYAVREKRKEFVEQQFRLVAEAQRQHKYSEALRVWRTKQEKLSAEPKLEDYSVQEELENLRRPRQRRPAADSDELDLEVEEKQIMSDMYDLARLSQTTISGAAYLREVLSKLDMVDPSSTTMPYQQLEASSASAAFLVNDHGLTNTASGHHSLRGLQYSQPDEIFVQSFSPALPGRCITALSNMATRSARWANAASVATRDSNIKTYLLAVGSRVTRTPVRLARSTGLYDATGRNLSQGTEIVRLADSAVLSRKNPVASQPVESRLADRHSQWDNVDKTFAALDLGYIHATTRVITHSVALRNDSSLREATTVGNAAGQTVPAEPSTYLPGTPHWVGSDERARSAEALTPRSSYLDRDRSNSYSQRLGATGARGWGHSSIGKALVNRQNVAERRRANLAGLDRQREQREQQEGGQSQVEDERGQNGSADDRKRLSPNVSSLLFD